MDNNQIYITKIMDKNQSILTENMAKNHCLLMAIKKFPLLTQKYTGKT